MANKVPDISQFNTVTDWNTVRANVDGVYIRLGYRGCSTGTITLDPKFNEHVSGARAAKVPYGIYFFPCSINEAEAHAEAKFIIAAAEKLDLAGPIYLDSEVVKQDRSGRSDKLSRDVRTHLLNVILQDLMDAGYACGVYASTSWWANNLNDKDLIPGCSRWVAQYAYKCTYNSFPYDAWQKTSSASIPGFASKVDLSEFYIDLKKSEDAKPLYSRQTVVDVMKSWTGYSEKDGRHKRIIDIYNYYLPQAVKKHGTVNYRLSYRDAWCAGAVSAAFIQAGMGDLFPVECSCPRMISIAQKMGIWVEDDNYMPASGDAVIYDWQDSGKGDNAGIPDHVGLVTSVDTGRKTFTVTEGNYDDMVKTRSLSVGARYIRGFVVPAFDDNAAEPSEAPSEAYSAPSAKVFMYSGTSVPFKVCKASGRVTASALNVRTWAGTENPRCTFSPLTRGATVEICDEIAAKSGEPWYYIRKNGKYGFVSAQYVEV